MKFIGTRPRPPVSSVVSQKGCSTTPLIAGRSAKDRTPVGDKSEPNSSFPTDTWPQPEDGLGCQPREWIMKISLKSTAIGLAAFGALAIAAPAWAGCVDAATKTPAMFEKGQAGDAHLIRVSNGPQIAGLWSVTFYQGNT